MSKRRDRERANAGLRWRDGRLVNVNNTSSSVIASEGAVKIPSKMDLWAMRKALEEDKTIEEIRRMSLGRKGIVLVRPSDKTTPGSVILPGSKELAETLPKKEP